MSILQKCQLCLCLYSVAEKKRALKEVNGMSMFGIRLKLTVCSKEGLLLQF